MRYYQFESAFALIPRRCALSGHWIWGSSLRLAEYFDHYDGWDHWLLVRYIWLDRDYVGRLLRRSARTS